METRCRGCKGNKPKGCGIANKALLKGQVALANYLRQQFKAGGNECSWYEPKGEK